MKLFKDLKNQMTAPPKLTLANLINMATKPRWCAGMLTTRRHSFGNVVGHAKGVGKPDIAFRMVGGAAGPIAELG